MGEGQGEGPGAGGGGRGRGRTVLSGPASQILQLVMTQEWVKGGERSECQV